MKDCKCERCGIELIGVHHNVKYCKECAKIAKKESSKEYRKTDAYKEYKKSDKYKEYQKEYQKSDKYKEYKKSDSRLKTLIKYSFKKNGIISNEIIDLKTIIIKTKRLCKQSQN